MNPVTAAACLIAQLVLLALIVVYLAMEFMDRRRDRRRQQAPVVPPFPVPWAMSPRLRARLTELIEQGNKSQAIPYLRTATLLGLREATYAVDAIAAGHDFSDLFLPRTTAPMTTEERAVELIAQGRRIQAIWLIREEKGLSLVAAKEVADGLSGFQAGPPTG